MNEELLNQILHAVNSHTKRFDEIDRQFKKIDKRFDTMESKLDEMHTESKSNYESLYTIVGELQGDIKELQCDAEYIAMKKMIAGYRASRRDKLGK